MRRVIVTGGRGYRGDGLVKALEEERSEYGEFVLYVGDCPTGADAIARAWAFENGVQVKVFAADWGRHGKRAGPIRNGEMVTAAKGSVVWQSLVCLAASGGRGTEDCVKQCVRAGVRVVKVAD